MTRGVENTSNSSNTFASNTFRTSNFPSLLIQGSDSKDIATNVFGASSSSLVSSPTFSFGQASDNNNFSQFKNASSAFGNASNSNCNSFAPNAFGNLSNTNNNPFATNSFKNSSNSNKNPFAINAFGSSSNSNDNLSAVNTFVKSGNSNNNPFTANAFGNSSHNPFSTNAFRTTTSTYSGHSTGVFGASLASSSSFTFGQQPASSMFGTTSSGSQSPFASTASGPFGGSLSMFGTGSTGSQGPFGSTSSRGSFGGSSSSVFRQGSGGTSTGLFGAPSTSFLPSPSILRCGDEPVRDSGSSAFVGLTNYKSNNVFTLDPKETRTPAHISWSNCGQTNTNILGTLSDNPFSPPSSTASPSMTAGSRIHSYKRTSEGPGSSGNLLSISAMPCYASKSHEELRWEDYELKSKGQQILASNQELKISKPKFDFSLPCKEKLDLSLPSFTSSMTAPSQLYVVPPLSTNMDTPTYSFPSLSSTEPSSALHTKTPSSTGPVWGQVRSEFHPKIPLPCNGISVIQENAASPLNTLSVSAVSNGDVFLDFSQTLPSHSQQISAIDEVKDSIIAVKDPFGSERATFQPSIGHSASSSLVQYGISSMPVADNKSPKTRVASILTSRHHSVKPLAVKVRWYHPSRDVPKVPFFDRVEDIQITIKAYSYLVPRENPKSVFAASSGLADVGTSKEEVSPLNHASAVEYKQVIDDTKKNQISSFSPNSLSDHFCETEDNAKEVNEQLIPKLQRSDYYTEPKIKKLVSIESSNPGFCCHVKDFVVGRHGYGRVKFSGETDVRGLDLDVLVHFNNRVVIVYDEDSKKPPVGQGLNKAAEVTLLNIKCIDRKTGKQYTNGKMVENFTEKLKKVTEKQGAEFVSYDPVKEEWKFSVQHF